MRKAKDEADFWWHLYFNEAVPTTECLHKELAALKAEKASSTLLRRYHHRIRKYLSESCSRSSVALDWKAYLKS
jgi:predicted metal-dependent peptidase